MVPLAPYFKNRELSDSLAGTGKRVNELVPFGVARGTGVIYSPNKRTAKRLRFVASASADLRVVFERNVLKPSPACNGLALS